MPLAGMVAIYDALHETGAGCGLLDIGGHALNALRMEKAHPGGNELTPEIGLVEAGMLRFFKPENRQFTGREATLDRIAGGPSTRLVCLAVDAVDAVDADCHGGGSVLCDGRPVGMVSSGGYGHRTSRSYAFAFVEPRLARPGTALEVVILEQARAATVPNGPRPTTRQTAASSHGEGCTMDVNRLDSRFGAKVAGLDLSQPLDPVIKSKLNTVFVDNVVLCIRGQSFDRPEMLIRAVANLGRPMAPVTATITLHTTGGLTGWRAVTGSPHFCSVRLTPGAEVAAGTARGLRRDSPHRVGSDPDRSFLPSVGTLAIRCEDHGENGTKQCGRELASLGDAQAHLLGLHAGDGGHRLWNRLHVAWHFRPRRTGRHDCHLGATLAHPPFRNRPRAT